MSMRNAQGESQATPKETTFHGLRRLAVWAGGALCAAMLAGAPAAAGVRAPAREVLFIDTALADYPALAAAARPGTDTVLLDPGQDEWGQIDAALRGRHGLEAVHLVSHGEAGAVLLGQRRLDTAALARLDLGRWRAALAPGADILLYGCNVAAGTAGHAFVAALAGRTGRVVAASSNATGNSALGGDWKLEVTSGDLATPPLRAERYNGLLALVTPTASYTLTGTTGLGVNSVLGLPGGKTAVLLNNGMGMRTLQILGPGGALLKSIALNALTRYSSLGAQYQIDFTLQALADGNLVVAYNANDSSVGAGYLDAYFFVLDLSGTKVVQDVKINTATGSSQTRWVHIAELTGGNIAFAYGLSTNADYAVRVFSATGSAVSAESVFAGNTSSYGLTGNRALYPRSLALVPQSTGGFLVLWCGGADPVSSHYAVMAMAYNANGVAQSIGGASFATVASGLTDSAQAFLAALPGGKVLLGCSTSRRSYQILKEDLSDLLTAPVQTTPANGYATDDLLLPIRTTGGEGFVSMAATYTEAPIDPETWDYSGVDYSGTDSASLTRYDLTGSIVENAVPIQQAGASGSSFSVDNDDYGYTVSHQFWTVPGYSQGLIAVAETIVRNGFPAIYSYTTVIKTYEIPDTADLAPTDLALSNASLALPAATSGAAVGSLTSTDADSSSFTYALVSGTGDTHNASFAISGASLVVGSAALAVGSYSVLIQTSDGSKTFAKAFTIAVHAVVPGAPGITGVSIGAGQATVTFSTPASDGGAPITSYTVTANPGGASASGSASPLTVTGLTNGVSYTFTVTASNAAGTGSVSVASASCTPRLSQSISFAAPADQSFGTSPTLSASADSGLAVTFSCSTPTIASVTSSGTLTFLKPGSATISADQPGDTTRQAAPTVTRTFQVLAVAPGAPTLTGVVAGDAQAQVSFTAPASTGGDPIDHYLVTVVGGGTVTGTASPIVVSGLTNGTSYRFHVAAVTAAGTGPASADSAGVTPMATQTITFPNPGTQTFGTTPTLSASSTSNLAVTFSSATPLVATVTPEGILSFLRSGTAQIHADQAGDSSTLPAARVSQSFTVAPVVPGAPLIGMATAGNARATVSFSAPSSDGGSAITGYQVYANGVLVASPDASPASITGLVNGTSYAFTVLARNAAGTGVPSSPSNSVVPAPSAPGGPGSVSAAAGDGQATVTFTAPSDTGGSAITGYTVTEVGGTASASGTGLAIVVDGLANHGAHSFVVSASNAIGTGVASAASNTVIPSPGGTVLIVDDGSTGTEQAGIVAQLARQGSIGNHLQVSTRSSLPAVLDSFDQIWDLRYADSTPLDGADQAAYLAFLQRGGMLFLAGGSAQAGARDTSLLALLDSAGAGTVTLAAADSLQQVRAPFTGPVTVAQVSLGSAAGAVALGNGLAICADAGAPAASAGVWMPGTLGAAPKGGLIVVLATDFLRSSADAPCQALVANLVSYQARVLTSAPVITGVEVPSAGSYPAGSTLTFTVHYSAAVTVTGTPALPLSFGGQAVSAHYASGSGTDTLLFTRTVQAGDNGALVLAPALVLCGAGSGTLTDANGFPARVGIGHAADTTGILADTTAPDAPRITSVSGRTVSGTAEAGSSVTILLGADQLAVVTADAYGHWSYTAPVNDVGVLTVIASDPAGNSSVASAGADLDTTQPVAGAVNATVLWNSGASDIALQTTHATGVNVVQGAAHGSASATGSSISYTPNAGYVGLDSFTYTASNASGTSSEALATIRVKSPVAPVFALAMAADGSVVADLLVNVGGTVTAANGVQSLALDGAAIPVAADGRFSFPLHLAQGANLITLVATDAAGLSTSLSRTVTLDTTAPTLTLSQPAAGAVLGDAHLAVAGSLTLAPLTGAADALLSVNYVLNGGPALPATLNGLAFAFTVDLVAGINSLELTATTTSGQTVQLQRTVNASADLFGAITDPPQDALVTASTYLLKGTVDSSAPPVTVAITLNGSESGPAFKNSGQGSSALAAGTLATQTVYTPEVVNGAYQQQLPLSGNQVWSVQVTSTDAQSRTMTQVRNFVKASTATPALFTLADALRAVQIANGLITATAGDLAKYDLCPRLNGVSTPDGSIDVEDAALVLWLALGQSL